MNKLKEETVEYRMEQFLRANFGNEFLHNKKVIAISCNQFGDTGKGKFVSLFSKWADIIARVTGGDNAGHTIIFEGVEYVLHLIPCGITDPDKINIIGTGTVIYPRALLQEIIFLKSKGFSCDNLRISLKANVILPSHVVLDRLGESQAGKERIGSTGKGIQPCYTDHVARRGLTMNDLLNPEVFRRKLKKALDYHTMIIAGLGGYEAAREIMKCDHLENGKFIGRDELFNFEAIVQSYLQYGKELRGIIEDTDAFMRHSLGKKNILLEGAQGYLLSIDYGTYPFVTSSDCSPAGMAKGAGLKESDIDVSFGIIKGFYMTRVGKGSFPTEMGDKSSEMWCNEGGDREKEKSMFIGSTLNDTNSFAQGVVLRRLAGEYGATTGRPRRTGWLDLSLLRYALDGGANQIILTKLDVLTGMNIIKVCHSYEYAGPDFNYGDIVLTKGDIIEKAIVLPEVLDHCTPLYKEFPGWTEDIRNVKHFSDLPENLINILKYVFKNVPATPRIISVGPGPDDTVFVLPFDLN
jgi:adenylosuccinate synthase